MLFALHQVLQSVILVVTTPEPIGTSYIILTGRPRLWTKTSVFAKTQEKLSADYINTAVIVTSNPVRANV